MYDVRGVPDKYGVSLRWLTRVLSILVSGAFLLILFLAATHEDKPQGAAIPVLALLVLTILATVVAWRWQKVGGIVVLLAVGLSAAAYSASLAAGLGSLSYVLALLYGAPFLVVGMLFWTGGRREASGSHHDPATSLPPLRRWRFIGAVLATIIALTVTIVVLMTGARVGGWLDVALNASGCLGVLAEHDSPVRSVAFSPDGALLAAGSEDGTVWVWGVADRRVSRWTLLHARNIPTGERRDSHSYKVAFSPDGRTLAFGLPDGSVRLWRLSADDGGGQRPADLQVTALHTLRVRESKICSLGFAPDGRTIVAGAGNGSVHLWRVTDGTHLRSLNGHANDVVSVAFSPDGAMVASASLDGTVRVWDESTGALMRELDRPPVTTGVAFSPDGSMLATDWQLWRVDDWTPTETMESARGGMGNVVFSPDGRLLAAGNAWYEVLWWRVADGALLDAVRGHRDSVNSVAFSPDGKTLVSGSLDGTVKLWRVP